MFTTLMLLLATQVYGQSGLDECRRGVRRAHPTQENGFQVFSRNGWRTQWIDQECPLYKIFDVDACDCVDGYQKTTVATTTGQAVTTTLGTPVPEDVKKATGAGCTFLRPHPENPSWYVRGTDKGWTTEDCNWPFYTGLIWNQTTCRCEWGPDRTFPGRRPDLSNPATEPCVLMLNMTFDQAIADLSRGLWLKRANPENAHIVQDPTAVGGACALFQDSTVSIPFFKSNTLGHSFHISFRFKTCPNDPEGEITLIHNGCADIEKLPPTLRLSYSPFTKEFAMEYEADNDVKPTREVCQLSNDATWKEVDVRYDESFLEVSINGVACIATSMYSGDIKTTDCPLSLPGPKSCVHLDEVTITRGCNNQA